MCRASDPEAVYNTNISLTEMEETAQSSMISLHFTELEQLKLTFEKDRWCHNGSLLGSIRQNWKYFGSFLFWSGKTYLA